MARATYLTSLDSEISSSSSESSDEILLTLSIRSPPALVFDITLVPKLLSPKTGLPTTTLHTFTFSSSEEESSNESEESEEAEQEEAESEDDSESSEAEESEESRILITLIISTSSLLNSDAFLVETPDSYTYILSVEYHYLCDGGEIYVLQHASLSVSVSRIITQTLVYSNDKSQAEMCTQCNVRDDVESEGSICREEDCNDDKDSVSVGEYVYFQHQLPSELRESYDIQFNSMILEGFGWSVDVTSGVDVFDSQDGVKVAFNIPDVVDETGVILVSKLIQKRRGIEEEEEEEIFDVVYTNLNFELSDEEEEGYNYTLIIEIISFILVIGILIVVHFKCQKAKQKQQNQEKITSNTKTGHTELDEEEGTPKDNQRSESSEDSYH